MEPTRRPWKLGASTVIWSKATNEHVCSVDFTQLKQNDFQKAQANAEHIVKCVNAYESLTDVNKTLVEVLKDCKNILAGNGHTDGYKRTASVYRINEVLMLAERKLQDDIPRV